MSDVNVAFFLGYVVAAALALLIMYLGWPR